jgi:hypothetical protein
MGIVQLDVSSIYEMEDGSKREVTGERIAEDGHMRVTFKVIEEPGSGEDAFSGFLDCSKDEFMAKAKRKI